MKFTHYSVITLSILLISTATAIAQTSTTETTEEISTTTATTSELAPVVVEATTPERQGTLSPRGQERVTNLAANLSNRFDVVIERLFNVMNRLESRLGKLETSGTDVSQARNFLSTARTSLAQARENMSTIDSQVALMVGSPNPREAWRSLRTTYSNTRELVRSAHADMRAAILSLQATTTEDTTN